MKTMIANKLTSVKHVYAAVNANTTYAFSLISGQPLQSSWPAEGAASSTSLSPITASPQLASEWKGRWDKNYHHTVSNG